MFVYTREAHPGEKVPHHDSMEVKLAHARLLRDEVGIRRPILIDTLDGAAHRAYGALPNMTYVITRGGRIGYKADWTRVVTVEAYLERLLTARRRPAGVALAPFRTEQLEYRETDPEAFLARLRRNGDRAVEEFRRAREIWASR